MTQPNERHRESPNGVISSLSVDQLDGLFDSFRDFVLTAANAAALDANRQDSSNDIPEVVREFAKRLSFLSEIEGQSLDYTRISKRLATLTDASMADMAIAAVDSETSKQRLAEYLSSLPYPHYEPVPGNVELVVQVQEDGTRSVGRFQGRKFIAKQDD